MPVEIIELKDKIVILVGTAHVSDASVKLVQSSIKEHKPDLVAVELCQQRFEALKKGNKFDEMEIDKVITSDQVYLFLLQIFLANFQRKLGDNLGIKPGAEMIAAMDAANEAGIPVLLADRDIKQTLGRAMAQMSKMEKLKILMGFFTGFIEGEKIDQELVEKLKEKDVLTELLNELAVETPSIKRVLVDERDAYIAKRIFDADAKKVMAVIGAGHMQGIIEHLHQMDSAEMIVNYEMSVEGQKLQGVSKSKINLIAYGVPAIFILLLAAGLFKHGGEMTFQMMINWFLINGTLSALGAAIAFAHPLTILAAFIAAPFTSLNPAIAAGWVAGYVELKMRKPRVVDFKNLMNMSGYSDWVRNRVMRVVLIVALANIGSTIGTIVALPYLMSLL